MGTLEIGKTGAFAQEMKRNEGERIIPRTQFKNPTLSENERLGLLAIIAIIACPTGQA